MILVDAIYICQTGGKNLLDLLIDEFEKESSKEQIFFLIDNRIKEFYIDREFKQIEVEFHKASEFARYKYYSKNKNNFRKVLCFANVPPPIKMDCEVMTYFHNVLLFDKDLQKYFSCKNRFLFALKGYLIKKRLDKTDNWLVQTDHVKELLVKYLKPNVDKVKILPFFNDETLINVIELEKKENAFFYPAIGAFHKNHDRLLQAWRKLYLESKINNRLHLTIDKNSSRLLNTKINKLQAEGVPIINHGYLSKTEVDSLYAKCNFVIHPSLGESFGLVLIEALKNNCILLAPDLPYVDAIVKPNYYFNATKTDSIEHTVKQAVSGVNCSNSEIFVKSEIEDLINYITK